MSRALEFLLTAINIQCGAGSMIAKVGTSVKKLEEAPTGFAARIFFLQLSPSMPNHKDIATP